MECITSRHNPVFKALVKARQDRSFLALEGRRLVEDALARGLVPRMAAVTPEYVASHGHPGFACTLLSPALLSRLCSTTTPQGVFILVETPWSNLSEIGAFKRVLVLDGIQDPGNVGTIIRTAEAFGFGLVGITPGTASPFSEKALRASMGSCLGARIARIESPGQLRDIPHRIIGLHPRGARAVSRADLTGRIALCLGQEAAGLSEAILALCHETIALPMPGGTESLNVAVVAGIVMAATAGVI